ncbi:MAG: PKD domain-containing protein [Bacteroidia bacterium]
MRYLNNFNIKGTLLLGFVMVGLLITSTKVEAQKNLAPTATAAASTCNTGPCSALNNQVINTTCTQEMWITTSTPPSTTPNVEWFDFTWSTPQSINSITIHHGNTATRFLAGADVYIWNTLTSAYVYSFTFSGLNNSVCVNTVKFPFNVTTLKLRFTKFQASGTQLSNMNFREIEIWQGSTKPNDVGISALTTPLCAPTIVATYTNFGTNTVDSAKIDWSVNGTMQPQMRYNTPTTLGNSANITLSPTFNFVDGTTYTVKVWTSLPNNKKDSVATNDTTKITFKYQGPAYTPAVSDVIKCGPGKAPLKATPVNAGDSIVWYNAATGGNAVAKGKNTLSPPLVLGVNTFYAQAFKISAPQKLGNGVAGTNYYTVSNFSGGMFDITPKNDLVVDSFTTHLVNFNFGQTFNVYMKTGTYIGFETNATAWTQIASGVVGRVFSSGTKTLAYVKIPETSLTKNVIYGFYVTTTSTMANSNYMTSGAMTISDAEMTVASSKMVYGAAPFTTIGNNYYMGLEVHYRKLSCPSSRVACKVTVKPSPNGATFIKSTPFETTQPNTIGTVGNPDIVAKGDKLSYEITPPTGYANVDYGTTWIMSGFTFRTKSGRVLPSSYYTPSNPTPSGSANAKVTFTADAAIVDTTIIMTVSILDLGPHYCDSLLTRNIFIAPRPVTDFKFGQPVCDGDNVIFTNTSSVSSGNLIHKWDFGTGNPADTSTNADVVFTFPTHGTYNVLLTTTTAPYGYTSNTTIPVVVTEIPKIGFKVFNACIGDSVSFVNSTTISAGTILYKWDFGNGTSSTKVNPKQKYPVAGGYKVTLTATSNGCSEMLTRNAQQFARPVAKYSIPAVLCDKTDIAFTNGSSIAIGNMGYTWNFGDGSVSGFANPLHSFATPGPKIVKMKVVSEFGCADSATKTLVLAEAPSATFTTGPICNLSPTSFNFTGTKPAGTLTSFLWDFAGEGISNLENPNKLFSITGKRTVTLTLTSDNKCSDKVSKEIDVKLQSKANFDAADVCEDEDAAFTNKSTVSAGNLLYQWKFGDGSTSSTQSPRHLYNIAGTSQTYNVTLVAIVPGGCSDSINKPVTVNAKPKADFTSKTSGRLVNFTATQPGNTTYQWDFGDGGKATAPSAQYNYLNYPSGKYNVCLTVFNAAGCFSQLCKEVAISGSINPLNKLNGTNIYPNPNRGTFTVDIEDPKSDIAIAIYNLMGELVKSIETNPLKSTYSVDLSMANGIYIVKITNGGLVSNQKISIYK